MNRDELIIALEAKYPQAFRTSEEFNGSEGGIWTSGEDGTTENGLEIFDYYSQDGGSSSYTFGVLNSLHNYLEEHGWYGEWNDPGTMMIWEA